MYILLYYIGSLQYCITLLDTAVQTDLAFLCVFALIFHIGHLHLLLSNYYKSDTKRTLNSRHYFAQQMPTRLVKLE